MNCSESSKARWLPPWLWLHIAIGLAVFAAAAVAALFEYQIAGAVGPSVAISYPTVYAVDDTNKACNAIGSNQGPHGMYIQVNISNTSGTTLNNLQVTLNGFSAQASSYYSVSNAANLTYALGLNESPIRYIAVLTPGESLQGVWFYITYPCDKNGVSWTYSATVSSAGGTTAGGNATIATRADISANAGGVVNSAAFGAGAVLGQVLTFSVDYDFGNPGSVPTLLVEPAGNADFNAGCFQLIATKVTSVLNFTGGTLVAGAAQNLYFVNSTGASGAHAIMEYQFIYLCQTGIGTVLSPFADDTSGTQQKYTPNFNDDRITVCGTVGACGFTPPVPSCSINVLETADVLPYVSGGSTVGALITYTALFTNNSAFSTSIQRVRNDLPNNVTYGGILPGSDVQPANSLSVPSFGASGSVTYTGILPNTSYKLSPNSTLALVYTATLTGGAGRYTDTVSSMIGTTTCGSASVPIQINNPTAVTLEKLQASETHGILAGQYQDIAYLVIVLSGVLAVCGGLARRRRTP